MERSFCSNSSQECPMVWTVQSYQHHPDVYQQNLKFKSQNSKPFSSTIPLSKIHATFHNLNFSLTPRSLLLATFLLLSHAFHFSNNPIKSFLHVMQKWQVFANIWMKLLAPQKPGKYLHQLILSYGALCYVHLLTSLVHLDLQSLSLAEFTASNSAQIFTVTGARNSKSLFSFLVSTAIYSLSLLTY